MWGSGMTRTCQPILGVVAASSMATSSEYTSLVSVTWWRRRARRRRGRVGAAGEGSERGRCRREAEEEITEVKLMMFEWCDCC